jgi:hypothetical protein
VHFVYPRLKRPSVEITAFHQEKARDFLAQPAIGESNAQRIAA